MFCSIARSPRLSRVAVAPAKNHRFLSMTCTQSVNKLYQILEEYRAKNFSEEYPKRFRKDIVKAATVNNRQRKVVLVKPLPPSQPFVAVSAEGIENVLQNIGMGHRISRAELDEIVSEVGGDVTIPCGGERQSVISANQMFNLINRDESQMAAIRTA
ncbi:hypothetical protein ACHAXA_003986 [Cyclostephanos tholiformis]|uniref:Uncharacterized protein n=1 Tax=Cyclostephanos tholiformis TaxID=382380 RepID=A0ABD3RJ34_9STRA